MAAKPGALFFRDRIQDFDRQIHLCLTPMKTGESCQYQNITQIDLIFNLLIKQCQKQLAKTEIVIKAAYQMFNAQMARSGLALSPSAEPYETPDPIRKMIYPDEKGIFFVSRRAGIIQDFIQVHSNISIEELKSDPEAQLILKTYLRQIDLIFEQHLEYHAGDAKRILNPAGVSVVK
jgi:hypothetical protein